MVGPVRVSNWSDRPVWFDPESPGEHGGTFATVEKHFWRDEVREVLSVAAYDSR